MKKVDIRQMYQTGICEDTVSKRTIITALAGIKKFLSENIYIVTPNKIAVYSIEETIYLKEYNDYWYIIKIDKKIIN